MACFRPVKAWQADVLNENGKRPLVFYDKKGYSTELSVRCGRCVGCRLERARQWGVRSYHETSCFSDNAFITLTYNNQNLPEDYSLHKDHWQKFMKRLRKRTGAKIRYIHCGEYGAKLGRPHYHACLFGVDFPDKVHWKTDNGFPLYTSKMLEELWPYGFSTIGEVTFESASYVARYTLKKFNAHDIEDALLPLLPDLSDENGKRDKQLAEYYGKLRKTWHCYLDEIGAEEYDSRYPRSPWNIEYHAKKAYRYFAKKAHYMWTMPDGEVVQREPEYVTTSLRPGLGAEWLEKYYKDVYAHDSVIYNGRAQRPPAYYDKLYERKNPEHYQEVKDKRKEKMLEMKDHPDCTPERLFVREQVKIEQVSRLFRNLDSQLVT